MYSVFRDNHQLYTGFEVPEGSTEDLLRAVQRSEIWMGHVLSYRKEEKEYGFDLNINDVVLKFVKPEFIATEDGLPPANVEA